MLRNLCSSLDFEPKTVTEPNFNTMLLEIQNSLGVAGSGMNYLCKDDFIKQIRIREFYPQWFVAAWNKDNYNPLITEYVRGIMQSAGMSS